MTSVSASAESPKRKRFVSSPSGLVMMTVPALLSTVTTWFQLALVKLDPDPLLSLPMMRPTRTAASVMIATTSATTIARRTR